MIRFDALVERRPEGRQPFYAVIGEALPLADKPGLAVVLRELPEREADGTYRLLILSPKPISIGDLIDDELPPGF